MFRSYFMAEKNGHYSVVVLPSGLAEPYLFTIKKRTSFYLLGIFSVFAFVFIVAIVLYFSMLGQVGELSSLRQETKTQKVEIRSVLGVVDHLKRQMTQLIEMDRRLRFMTDLSPRKGGAAILGLGGPEDQRVPEIDESELMAFIRRDLKTLEGQVAQQEQSFQELTGVVLRGQALLAATPSVWPADGLLMSPFGRRLSPFTDRITMHHGIDIGASYGAPVIAPAEGRVSYVGFDDGFGKIVKLTHGYGIVTHYGHLSKTAVRNAQKVKRGETIGYVGSTGLSTGPHLHYEVLVKGVPVDPMKYILNEKS